MRNLVIVESPAKSKTISKILNKNSSDNWDVTASRGYIKELPKKEFALSFDDGFSAKWVYDEGKKKLIAQLKKTLNKYDNIYIATDDDLEGEKIAFDLVEELKIHAIYKRVTFSSITKKSILEGIDNPREIDEKKYNLACNRRYVDRDEGYGITNILKYDFRRKGIDFPPNIAVGRSISPALHIIVENEKQIREFEPQEYKRVKIRYIKDGIAFEYLDAQRYFDANSDDQVALSLFMRNIACGKHKVISYIPKQEEETPPEPLYTATLQSSSFSVFGFSGKKTMKLAQELYDSGLITYHRTDSNIISDSAYEEILDYLYKTEDVDNIYDTKRKYKKRSVSQESHEAIRAATISIDTEPGENIEKYAKQEFGFEMSKEHKMLYELIWRRTVVVQMANAIYDRSIMKLEANGGVVLELRANSIVEKESDDGKVIKLDGWLKNNRALLQSSIMQEGEEYLYKEVILPRASVLDEIEISEISYYQTKTKAPHRYGEGRFATTLEKLGIARPSSLAGVVPSLEDKKMIEKNNGVIRLKKLGEVVDEWISENCSWLNSIDGVQDFDEMMKKGIDSEDEKTKILYEIHEKIEKLKEDIGFEDDAKTVYPASEAQISVAKQIALKKKLIIKEEYYNDSKKMHEFISKNIETTNEENIGKCPSCGNGKIVENSKAFGCSCYKDGCKFTIWKDSSINYLKKFGIMADEKYLKDAVSLALRKEPLSIQNKQQDNKEFYLDVVENSEKWMLKVIKK